MAEPVVWDTKETLFKLTANMAVMNGVLKKIAESSYLLADGRDIENLAAVRGDLLRLMDTLDPEGELREQ